MKRVLTIQDISCLGKCSLTIALPVISALGSEAVILPTALLSTHTMFDGFTVKDLTDQIEPITSHWKKEGVKFDAIYTGYLGTAEQIDMVKEIFRDFRDENTLVFVDPVMADNGKLYPVFDMDYARKNVELCAEADIIVPNITEGSFMTGMDYREEYDESYIREMLMRLNDLGSHHGPDRSIVRKGQDRLYGLRPRRGRVLYLPERQDRRDLPRHRRPVLQHMRRRDHEGQRLERRDEDRS